MNALDLFAGPGGWEVGAQALGLDPLGVELDDAACLTREAAGLRTLQADVAQLDPADHPCDLLIASPPCQAWSMAGKRKGEADKPLVYKAANRIAEGDGFADLAAECEDDRSMLVVEPLRWALATRPRLLAFEQVPPVLVLWRYFADLLREADYEVWCGNLETERYGVPQTRKRAILMASSEAFTVHPPEPTHQRYVKGRGPDDPGLTGLLPWISMAEALGWGMTERPSVTVPATSDAGGPRPLDGGSGARRTVERERDEGSFILRANSQTNATERSANEPAPTIKGGHDTGDRVWMRHRRPNAAARAPSEPAPTVHFGDRINIVEWVTDTGNTRGEGEPLTDGRVRSTAEPAPPLTSRADQLERRASKPIAHRPAPTITTTRKSDEGMLVGRQLDEGEGRNVGGHGWVDERPATTVQGDPRVNQPGHKKNADSPESPGRNEGAVRVTLEEAAILQGFPPGYPWQGSRTKRFEQVGNAVPPPLAAAVLDALLASDPEMAVEPYTAVPAGA